MKSKLIAIIESLISAVIALLGFSSCDSEVMYGSPNGDFRVSGLVTDEEGIPIDKARVIVRPYVFGDGMYYHHECDTLTTDLAGKYWGEINGIPSSKIVIVCEDPQGAYQPDSVEIKPKYENGDHDWYEGVATAEVNFKLNKAAEN